MVVLCQMLPGPSALKHASEQGTGLHAQAPCAASPTVPSDFIGFFLWETECHLCWAQWEGLGTVKGKLITVVVILELIAYIFKILFI